MQSRDNKSSTLDKIFGPSGPAPQAPSAGDKEHEDEIVRRFQQTGGDGGLVDVPTGTGAGLQATGADDTTMEAWMNIALQGM
jgi:hypothetical protein